MTTHLLYHADCTDGFTAAWAAWKTFGESCQYIPVRHGDPPPALPPNADVVIVDFSYPRAELERMKANVKSLLVLDHHKTAQEDLKGLPYAVFDMEKSGARLAWEYFSSRSEAPPLLVHYVEDRDLWRWSLEASRQVSAWIGSFTHEFNLWDVLSERLYSQFDSVVEIGAAILRAQEKEVNRSVDRARVGIVLGYRVWVVNATSHISEVGMKLLELHPEIPFSAVWFERVDGRRHWSLRSRGDVDVSEVARRLGGGGHRTAAGFIDPPGSGPGTPLRHPPVLTQPPLRPEGL